MLKNYVDVASYGSCMSRGRCVYKREKVTILCFLLDVGVFFFYSWCLGMEYSGVAYRVQAYKLRKVIATFLHCVPIVGVAVLYLKKKIDTKLFALLLGISRGYLLYDTGYLLYEVYGGVLWKDFWCKHVVFMLHHLLFFVVTYYTARYADYIAMGVLAEIPTIFLNYVLAFRQDEIVNKTFFFKLFGVVAIMSYFMFRVANFCVLSWRMVQEYKNGHLKLVELMIVLLLCVMNCVWFVGLLYEARQYV